MKKKVSVKFRRFALCFFPSFSPPPPPPSKRRPGDPNSSVMPLLSINAATEGRNGGKSSRNSPGL